MKKSFLLASIAIVLCLASTSRAQSGSDGVSAVGSNLLRVGSGTGGDEQNPERKRYMEEIANARIFFNNLSIGLRYEMDDPSEVGRSFQGLRRRWIQYKKDKLEVQAGDVTALFGRGLSVNLFESRPLNFDAWLDGAYGAYEYSAPKSFSDLRPSIGVKGVAGKLDFVDILPTTPVMNISARAINGEFGLLGKKVILGTSFLQAFTKQGDQILNNYVSREVNQPEVYLNFLTGEFEGFLQWTEMRSHLDTAYSMSTFRDNVGHALYGSLSYSNSDFGITVDYKNYRYADVAPGDTNEGLFGKLPISNPPEVYKDFTYTSITRFTHAVNFNDELGLQAEVNITAIPNVNITLNGAASSRHNAYTKFDSLGRAVATESTNFLPKLNDFAFYPFWEAFGEVEYEFGSVNYVRVFAHRRSDIIAGYQYFAPQTTERRRTTTIGGKFQYETTPSQSILAIIEHQWNTETAVESKSFINELITLQYSFNPLITFGGMFDYSTDYTQPKHIWPQVFTSVRIGESNTLLVSYGAERGGLNCTGGICRPVPPFNGLRLTLTSQI